MIVRSLGIYLPALRMSAAEIASASGIPVAVVRGKMGISQKTLPGPDDHSNAMGVRAARLALAEAGIAADEVDVLISMTEEHKEFPVWTAGIEAAHQLGASRAWAFDIGQKCGSGVLGLKMARDMLVADPEINTVLLAGGYRNGDLVDLAEPSTRFMNNLAAGGGAALVTRSGPGFEILGSSFRTDGRFSRDVLVPVGGSVEPITAENLHRYRFHIADQPGLKARLEQHSLERFTEVIAEACARSGLAAKDLAYAGLLHMKRSAHEEVLRRAGIASERSIYLSDYGHVGQIDPLLSLKLARDAGRLRDGDAVLLCTAGLGYVWNAICLRYRCPP